MPVAALMKDIDPGLLELLKREEGALVTPPPLGPEAPPVKLPQSVKEVAPGGRERRSVVFGGGCRHGSIPSKASVVARSVLWTLTGHTRGLRKPVYL